MEPWSLVLLVVGRTEKKKGMKKKGINIYTIKY